LSERLKVASDEERRMASGRLFQARGPATAKARSPSVDLRVAGNAQSGRLMRLSANDAVIPCSPPDWLSVEGSMVLIRVGNGIPGLEKKLSF